MTTATMQEALRSHPFLEGFDQRLIDLLSPIVEEIQFDPGEIIVHEAGVNDYFFLLLEGSVTLEIRGPGRTLRIQELGAGEELGWSSALPSTRRHFEARALKSVHALALEGKKLRRLFEQDHELGYRFNHRLLGVVAHRLQATQMQLIDSLETKGTPMAARVGTRVR